MVVPCGWASQLLSRHTFCSTAQSLTPACWLQVVYSGPMLAAAGYFRQQGYQPDSLRSNIADFMLDLVIKSADEQVHQLVQEFAR